MGLADVFSKEERVEVTFTDFYRLMRESAKCSRACKDYWRAKTWQTEKQ